MWDFLGSAGGTIGGAWHWALKQGLFISTALGLVAPVVVGFLVPKLFFPSRAAEQRIERWKTALDALDAADANGEQKNNQKYRKTLASLISKDVDVLTKRGEKNQDWRKSWWALVVLYSILAGALAIVVSGILALIWSFSGQREEGQGLGDTPLGWVIWIGFGWMVFVLFISWLVTVRKRKISPESKRANEEMRIIEKASKAQERQCNETGEYDRFLVGKFPEDDSKDD